ncbi:MAG: hypothetical protein ACRETN_11495 [Nevskiales bacterium]
MLYVKAFIAGFVSTLVFHQGVLALLHAADSKVPAPFNMAATAPLHVPAVVSLAFWGGLWGIVLWLLIRNLTGMQHWGAALLIGAIGPSIIAWFVVMPMKGMGMMGGWDPKIFVGALILNAAWGVGVALIMRGLQRLPGMSG